MNSEKILVKFGTKLHELERVTGTFKVFSGAFIFRKQFPITAYVISIHKSQGISVDNCIENEGNSVFVWPNICLFYNQ